MAIPGRLPGAGTYFVTPVTSGRRRLFQVAANAELFLETLPAYRRQGHYKLHAFVVMPDHIHLLLTPQGETIERVMGLIRGGSSHRSLGRDQSGSVASQIIAFAMQRTSGPGARTSIKIL
jgi:putative transposase